MARRSWTLAALTAAVMFAATAASAAADYPALVRAMSKAVADGFYDPSLRGLDWAGLTRRYEARAGEVRDDAAFRRLATEMLGALKVSHLDIAAPAAPAPRARPAVRTRVLNGATTVTEVAALSDAQVQGLRPGFRLLDPAALPGPLGSAAPVAVEDCAGARRSVAVRRESGFWPPAKPAFRWSRIRSGPGATIGYLRVDAFEDDGAQLADQAMSELGDTDALVIDVRGNDGGNASAVRLASYFTGVAGPGVILLSRDYLKRLGRTPTPADALRAARVERTYTSDRVFEALRTHGGAVNIWTEDLGAKRYGKPVVLLIGAESASAAEGFAWVMRQRSPARLIGEPTAGALLSAERVDLGQGWSMRVPTAGVWAPDGVDYGDRPVPPHDLVAPARADLCAGRDVQLEAGTRWLRARLPSTTP